jgi:acyl-CoA synthetase (NDP forming)
MNLDHLFNPKSIAVIGASRSPGKVGTMTLLSIIGGGFKGEIYPINPKEEEILGLKAYKSVKETPSKADIAIICVPTPSVPQVVKECAGAKVRFGVVISSGFGEVDKEGKDLQQEVVKIAKKGGMRLIGPNCMGMASSQAHFYALMNMLIPMAGDVSVVSQSGTLGSLCMVYASEQSVGFNKFISSGNEADLHTEDFIEYLALDPETKVIFSFLEGIRDGRKFLSAAKEATKRKPFIVLKGGVTEAGAKAASSHTGSMAGSTFVYNAAFKQAGITQAIDEKDAIGLIKAFSLLSSPKGRKVGIVSAWGGTGVLASDACAKEGLDVVDLPPKVMEELNRILPPFWSHRNPVDLTAAGIFGDFRVLLTKSVEALLKSDNIDAIICTIPCFKSLLEGIIPRMDSSIASMFSETSMGGITAGFEKEIADELIKLKRYQKPIAGVVIGFYEQRESEGIKLLEDNGIPVYETPNKAAYVLAKLIEYREYLEAVGMSPS